MAFSTEAELRQAIEGGLTTAITSTISAIHGKNEEENIKEAETISDVSSEHVRKVPRVSNTDRRPNDFNRKKMHHKSDFNKHKHSDGV